MITKRLAVALTTLVLAGSLTVQAERVAKDGEPKRSKENTLSDDMVSADNFVGQGEIAEPFKKIFKDCTKDMGNCEFQNMGIMGDKAHQSRCSCHNNMMAIDVGRIICGGKVLKPEPKGQNSEDYFKITKCIAKAGEKGGEETANKQLAILFHRQDVNIKKVPNHEDHMHIEIKGCMQKPGACPGGGKK